MVEVCTIYLAQPGVAHHWSVLGWSARWLGGARLTPPRPSYKGARKARPVKSELQPFNPPFHNQKYQVSTCEYNYFVVLITFPRESGIKFKRKHCWVGISYFNESTGIIAGIKTIEFNSEIQ